MKEKDLIVPKTDEPLQRNTYGRQGEHHNGIPYINDRRKLKTNRYTKYQLLQNAETCRKKWK